MGKIQKLVVVLAMVCVPIAIAGAQGGPSDSANKGQDRPVSNDQVQTQVDTGVGQQVDQEKGLNSINKGEGNNSNIAPSSQRIQAEVKTQQRGQGTSSLKQGRGQEVRVESGTTSLGRGQQGPSEQALQRRSRVANAVQEIKRVGEKNQGIGEQVRVIAQNQEIRHQRIEDFVEGAKKRKGFMRFLVGPEYNKLERAQENLDKYGERLEKLKEVKDGLESEADKEVMNNQIQELEQIKEEWQQETQELSQGFSLFGWAIKLFS